MAFTGKGKRILPPGFNVWLCSLLFCLLALPALAANPQLVKGGSAVTIYFTANFNVSAPSVVTAAPCSAGSFTPGASGLGVDGAPVPCDYWSGSHQFQQNVAPVLKKLLILIFVIFAIWIGIKRGKTIVHMFGSGWGHGSK